MGQLDCWTTPIPAQMCHWAHEAFMEMCFLVYEGFLTFTFMWECLWGLTSDWLKYQVRYMKCIYNMLSTMSHKSSFICAKLHTYFSHFVSCWFSKLSKANLPFVSLVTMDRPLWCNMGVWMSSLTPLVTALSQKMAMFAQEAWGVLCYKLFIMIDSPINSI